VSNPSTRIAFFIPALHGGGAERVILNLASAFAEDQNLTIDLVLAQAEGVLLFDIPTRVRLVNLNASRLITCLPKLINYLRREKPKAMLSAMCHANVIAVLAKKIAGSQTRLVISEHGMISKRATHSSRYRDRLLPYLMRCSYPLADEIVAVSKGVAEDLVKTLGVSSQSVRVIYNPVISERLFASSLEKLSHRWLGPERPAIILAVGRLVPEKDFVTLIQAFALLRKWQQAKLIILGEGPERQKLSALIQTMNLDDEVDLPGFVANPYPYMRQANLLVLSSIFEGLGNVLVEALAVDTPVVATDCPGGPAEILENGRWGKLVPLGDTNALAQAMAETLNNEVVSDKTQRLKDFNIKIVTEYYKEALLPS
jgi:glycosyltransferase involved in cell wall biosynthesis